jgi:hypothetical protein
LRPRHLCTTATLLALALGHLPGCDESPTGRTGDARPGDHAGRSPGGGEGLPTTTADGSPAVAPDTSAKLVCQLAFKHRFIGADPGGKGFGIKVLANLDGDADLEYVVGRRDDAVLLFDRQSDGSWTQHTITNQAKFSLGGAAADIDGDGRLDLVTGSYWYRNNGDVAPDKKFTPFRLDDRISVEVHDAGAADLDGDGQLEVVLLGDGFRSHWYDVPASPDQNTNWPRHELGPVNTQTEDIHGAFAPEGIGDLDGDGDPDIVFPDYWLENKGAAQSWGKRAYGADAGKKGYYGWASRSFIVDFDGDGDNDIVMSDCDGKNSRAWILLNDGAAASFTRVDLPLDASQRGSLHAVAAADFDGDGDMDVFTSDQEDTWQIFPPDNEPKTYIFANQGDDKTFTAHVVLKNLGLHDARIGDVDGDGDVDIVASNWSTWSGNANGGKPHVDLVENVRQCVPAD